MTVYKVVLVGLLLVLATSFGICDTVVYHEDFSGDGTNGAAWVTHPWVYNNSGSSNSAGYQGSASGWPGHVGDQGAEILGFQPNQPYYATNFEGSAGFSQTSLSGQDGWVGVAGSGGNVVYLGESGTSQQAASFQSASAYKTLVSSPSTFTSGQYQYVQCYAMCPNATTATIYVGNASASAVAGAVKFNPSTYMIQALNGTTLTWVNVSQFVPGLWYLITFRMNYNTPVTGYSYQVAIYNSYNSTAFPFRDSAAKSATAGISVKLEETGGATFYVDDVYAGNSPYAPGQDLRGYWSDSYNRWCQNYGQPLTGAYDTYDWMSCKDNSNNPINGAAHAPAPFTATLPTGWTAAFGYWADMLPQDYYGSARGKMGFGQFAGATPYSQTTNNPCLHVWSSHGDLRVVGPNVTTGPGIYTLTWKGAVFNLNTADPSMQYKWTDWCSWGYGYANWCVWDAWDPTTIYNQTTPPYPMYLGSLGIDDSASNKSYWTWPHSPFTGTNPDDLAMINDPARNGKTIPHPSNEAPGAWHSYSAQFAFGALPVRDGFYYNWQSAPGYFIGFQVSHGHDPWNAGYQWGTILNIDDIQLTKKSPSDPKLVQTSPVGTALELTNMVIENQINNGTYVDLFLVQPFQRPDGKYDAYNGVMVRVSGDLIPSVYTASSHAFVFHIGDVVRVVGAVTQNDIHGTTQPNNSNPVKYLGSYASGDRLPAVIGLGTTNTSIRPVAVSNNDLVGNPVTPGAPNNSLLVTVWGQVNTVNFFGTPYYFYVNDGSARMGLAPGEPESGWDPATGVKIDCSALGASFETPNPGDYVSVTGTCTAMVNPFDHTSIVRVVYPRTAADVKTHHLAPQ